MRRALLSQLAAPGAWSGQWQCVWGQLPAACCAAAGLDRNCLASAPAPSQPQVAGPFAAAQQARAKHSVRMVLLEDVASLGQRGDIVRVSAGHARYILFPRGQADYAVPQVVRTMRARGELSEQALSFLRSGAAAKKAAAAQVDPSTLPHEQQLPLLVNLLATRSLVIRRRSASDEPPRMIGNVTKSHIAAAAAKQLGVEVPRELILMQSDAHIDQFGSFKVPLNLRDAEGQQVELSVAVEQTRLPPKLRAMKQLFPQAWRGDRRSGAAGRATAAAGSSPASEAGAAASSSSGAGQSPEPQPELGAPSQA